MTHRLAFPLGDVEDLPRLLNRPHRNEVSVAVSCLDPMATASRLHGMFAVEEDFDGDHPHLATRTVPAVCPYLAGFVLRRVRIVGANALARTTSGAYLLVRALLSTSRGSDELGRYDSRERSLAANTPMVLSASNDLDKRLDPGVVLSVEVTQGAWPKISAQDKTVFFDLGVT